jgi:outer membrane protein assembly factor BamB
MVAAVVVAVLSLVTVDPMAAESWPSFRGPGGVGRASEALPPGDGPLALALGWKRPLGSGYSGISIVDGRLVTAMAEGDRDYVVALDTTTGQELWRYDLAPTYAGHDGSHDGPISTPAVADGRVFMLSPSGHVAALDFGSGSKLWTAHLVDDLGCEPPYYGFGGSPAVVGDLLVLQVGGAEGAVAAFDASSGALRWRSFPDEGLAGSQSPIVAEVAGREQILVLGSSRVGGLEPATGAVLWELALEGGMSPMGVMTQSPMPIDGSRLFVKHLDGEASVVEVSREGGGLTARVLAAGKGLARSYSPPTLAGDRLFGYSARFLSALDPDTGELSWRSREPGDGFVLSVGDQLAVVTKTGGLHLGSAETDAWEETAGLQLFEDLAWTPPSYADGSFFARSLGEIARVDLVRESPSQLAQADSMPDALAPLERELSAAGDPALAVARFLEGRELPLIDGDEVVFLWHGEADDVAIGGDMIGMRREEPMHRLAGTDLWWWATELDPRARVSYLFFVDYEPAIDPTHDRATQATVLGPNMDWFRGEAVTMSWFAMPEWPGLVAPADVAEVPLRGRVETIEIALQPPVGEAGEDGGEGEAPEAVSVPVHVWLPPGYDEGEARYPVVYLHNTAAREAGDWPATLDRVVGRTVEPLIAVFHDAPRMRGFGDLFAGQIVPAIDERYRTVAHRDARANVGMGWPAFSASLMTFGHGDTFGRLGIQSLYLLEDPMSMLLEAMGDADAASLPMRIYLEWGRWDLVSPHEEMNMRRTSQWAWEVFNERGWAPTGGEVWDSTDFASWRNRTDVLLEALFPLDEPSDRLAVWQTGR